MIPKILDEHEETADKYNTDNDKECDEEGVLNEYCSDIVEILFKFASI